MPYGLFTAPVSTTRWEPTSKYHVGLAASSLLNFLFEYSYMTIVCLDYVHAASAPSGSPG
jgi:hypothetical protein